MKPHNRFLAICLIVLLAQIPGLSQDNNLQSGTAKPVNENSKPEIRSSTRKIAPGSFEMDLDIDIDENALETDIEIAIDNAMRSVEIVLEGLPVHLDLKTDFNGLDMEFDPIDINLGDLDIDIEPVEFDLEDMGLNIKRDDDDFRFNNGEQTKMNLNTNEKNNQKSKGLKKIN
jgi:hypothetical protein